MSPSRVEVTSTRASTSARDGAPGRGGAFTSSTADSRSLAMSRRRTPTQRASSASPPHRRRGGDQPEHDRGDREQHGDQPAERQDRERGRTAGRDHRAEQRQHQGDAGGCGHRVQPHPPGLVPVHERADTLQERRDRSARDSHDVALSCGDFEHSAPTSRCRGPDAFAAQVV